MIDEIKFYKELDKCTPEEVRTNMATHKYSTESIKLVENWLLRKEKEKQQKDNLQDIIREKYKNYRNSGIAFSVTLITLSTALIAWTYQLYKSGISNCLIFPQFIAFSATIISCLCIQFFNYQGYKSDARVHFEPETRDFSTYWFSKEDKAVYWSIGFFVFSLLLLLISSIIFTTL